jgi:trehalose 6-phosphate phosphatase
VQAQLQVAGLLEPLRADPARSAALLDVDGTLAPIVRHPSDANVPEPTRARLIELARRYGIVACVSGRSAAVARQLVSIGSIAYVGNHGAELLLPGATEAIVDPALAGWAERVARFADAVDTPECQRLRVRREDKGPIVAFHWRGAPDEDAALAAVIEIEDAALQAGLVAAPGRKVLEIRPPVPIDKGRGVAWLLTRSGGGEQDPPHHGLYVGDDVTDIDAFRGLREVVGEGAVCIGVRSDETPGALVDAADAMVDGPAGVFDLLEELLR